MTPRDHVLERLRLRTHPFAPEVATDGSMFAADPLERELDPTADPRLLSYYFDLYDWSSSPWLKGISPTTALDRFPKREDLNEDGPLLVLVSGTGQSGRGSLVNLIIHKIHLARAANPLVIRVKFNSADLAQSVKQLANKFVYGYNAQNEALPTRADLQAIFDRETKTRTVDGEAYYSSLFDGLSTDVRLKTARPIVFVVSGGDRFDLWSCLYHSSAPLADYLLVETPKMADAITCHTVMSAKGKNVVHVSAPKLDLATARLYIEKRLQAERPAAGAVPDQLIPFTPQALSLLFEPGTSADTTQCPHAIGWLRKTLRRALQEHIAELTAKVTAQGPGILDHITVDELFISRNMMWKVRQQMNEGD